MSKILFVVFALVVICTSYHGALAKPSDSDSLQNLESMQSSHNETEQTQSSTQDAASMNPPQNETEQAQNSTPDANMMEPSQNETEPLIHAQEYELKQYIFNETDKLMHTIQYIEMLTALKIEAAQLKSTAQELELIRHQPQSLTQSATAADETQSATATNETQSATAANETQSATA